MKQTDLYANTQLNYLPDFMKSIEKEAMENLCHQHVIEPVERLLTSSRNAEWWKVPPPLQERIQAQTLSFWVILSTP